ncbi:hypothetical protein MLD38_005362 [Melastoma candidum]|uniref:Uncharacterized protein n=1 Tax=Melastoma candidum TaxID=119954 RepID=A0ACB9SAI9_9MYRT|nr:hypothetical protein MLD38_005362 [Melastoma candidum]
MSVLLREVPPELIRTLGSKEMAKEAWDTLKIMRVGVERAREAKAQTRRVEFENLAFKDGEGVEAFGIRLTAIVNDLEMLGDPVSEHMAVLKFLRSVPRVYKQLAMAIESLVDLKTLSIEELTGRLLVVEERGELDDVRPSGEKLLLTEEEWQTRQRQRERGKGSFRSGNKNGKTPIKSGGMAGNTG